MKTVTGLLLAFGLTIGACGGEPAEPEAPPAPAAMPAPPAPPAPVALADDDVAVAEDFIEEATTEVTADNYKAKLDEIDQEISSAAE
jgi:hypothetical protein